jgi:hypothetical protein
VSEVVVRFLPEGRIEPLNEERDEDHMIVDCSDCKVRDIACADCVVTVLLGAPGWPSGEGVHVSSRASKIDIDQEELGAMGVLADVGLVPRLRLVTDADQPTGSTPLPRRDKGADQRAV